MSEHHIGIDGVSENEAKYAWNRLAMLRGDGVREASRDMLAYALAGSMTDLAKAKAALRWAHGYLSAVDKPTAEKLRNMAGMNWDVPDWRKFEEWQATHQ